MNYTEAVKVLSDNNQGLILKFWNDLSEEQKTLLLSQVADLDFNAIGKMRDLLAKKNNPVEKKAVATMSPAHVSELVGEARDAAERAGAFEIRNGHVAALVVAGGQGSRLGYNGPKGCLPIGPISNESLFFFHAREILALGKTWESAIPLYVMTSQDNDAQTQKFFEENKYFGLEKKNVFFFKQAMWPALDADGKIILDELGHIFMSPDGHGGTLNALKSSGGLADMIKRGITSVFYFQVDNPLVTIADPAFIGFHKLNQADISIKVCAKRDPNEGLGVAVERNDKTEIVEYTEFTPEQKNERLPNGELKYKYGSVAIHIFSTDFLTRESNVGLPLHIAHKKVPYCDDAGKTVKPTKPNAFKFEKFIFDALADAKISACLAFERSEEFAPVKNADGDDSPATCKAALSAKWAGWLKECGVKVPCDANGMPKIKIEIDPLFAHSADTLHKKISENKLKINTSEDILLK